MSATWTDIQDTAPVSGDTLPATLLTPLPEAGVIAVEGPDATTFLHSQLTHDIEGMPEGSWRLAGWCNPKGRLLALFRVVRDGDQSFRLLCPGELVTGVMRRLQMFILRARVTLDDRSGEQLLLGLYGEEALDAATRELNTTLPEPSGTTHTHGATLLALAADRALLIAGPDRMKRLWLALHHLPVGDPQHWRLLQIRAGEPEIFQDSQDLFIPQMANLDVIDGLSFRKGCYPGQEVVARMHYLGRLKKRMFPISGTGLPPRPGTEVRDPADKRLGQVVVAESDGEDSFAGLAVLPLDHAEYGAALIEGKPITVGPLPEAAHPPSKGRG
ncbi:YgfZ/GcvT domain-containing protein [Alkalilimnicola ehrlichii MLHE-1]|uniref:Glycine cleavage T protein (Aminomethyl transferase) n=1 Tax=Alkalilimnicola ehrlichii (strain ATCC BAA-1101 / DSM 17681 / MLHE-1) TaxID=187272 RepID=Q0A908_ALKEH|nr:folate-binding protein YgfZ [Alkalilimnicola ehrlichii]ABI56679.1 glycine cleavage T protein (aminomethyl transferase) [Alkalilimnicola ehrlichii MLHE-1]